MYNRGYYIAIHKVQLYKFSPMIFKMESINEFIDILTLTVTSDPGFMMANNEKSTNLLQPES